MDNYKDLDDEPTDLNFPNIDGMDDADLASLDKTVTTLSVIIGWTITARKMRAEGDIDAAQHYERMIEKKYNTLPDSVKW